MRHRIHIFRCATQDLYGVTRDHAGANLPLDECQDWTLVRTVEFDGHLPPWGMDVAWQERGAAIEAGLAMNGYFLSEAAALPPDLLKTD